MQALIYPLHAFEYFGNKINTVIFQFVFFKSGIVKTVRRHREDIPEMQKELICYLNMYLDAASTENFPMTASPYCNHCPCKKICEKNVFWRKNNKIDIPTTDKEFIELFEQYHVTKKYMEEIKDVLNTYADASGKENIGAVDISVKTVEKMTVSTSKKTRAYLEETYPKLAEKKWSHKNFSREERNQLIRLGHIKDSSYKKIKLKLVSVEENEDDTENGSD